MANPVRRRVVAVLAGSLTENNWKEEKGGEHMEAVETSVLPRKRIVFRLLYSLVFVVVVVVFQAILLVTVLFQYIYLLITRSHSDPLRNFCNRISAHTYRALRYISLGENARPFPFSEFPDEIEPVESDVDFG